MIWDYDHDTTILGGLPVQVRFSVHGEDRPATRDCPAEHAEIEYQVFTRAGKPAPWAENRMSPKGHQALLEELWSVVDGWKDDYWESVAEDRAWERRYG